MSAASQRVCLTVAYDGTDFSGWQIQPGRRTVQAELERALEQVVGCAVRLHHSGRTDAGVHARGQVAHVDVSETISPKRLLGGVNAVLDPDVRVMRVARVAADFHARFDAISKEYRYFIWNGPALPPDLRRYRMHERRRLDLMAMRTAAQALVGEHDFASFAANPRREIGGTVKTVSDIALSRSRDGDVMLRVTGEGFLYKMVRSIAGFLWRTGLAELHPEDATRLLSANVRTNEIPTLPAKGLFLWRVTYPPR